MKNQQYFPYVLLIALLCLLMVPGSCKKSDNTPLIVVKATTNSASLVGQRWATLNGTVNASNQFCTVTFEYDTTSAYKNNINGIPDTLSGNTDTYVHADLTDLKTGTNYYYRVKVVSKDGTTYGSEVSFTTSTTKPSVIVFRPDKNYGSVTDIDGNIYKTILIGTQTWMAENLKTTKFNDRTVISFINNGTAWQSLSTPGYTWYNYDSVAYGALYNWYAVSTGRLCPTGWHVPGDAEWTTLTGYLGGENVTGGKLKEPGVTHWFSPNAGATNESGFTALPGGYRSNYGTFTSIRRTGFWWSSTEASSFDAYCRSMDYTYASIDRSSSNKVNGFSIRCIKD
jgi:uncharacterized protein (TIGR02145 family)